MFLYKYWKQSRATGLIWSLRKKTKVRGEKTNVRLGEKRNNRWGGHRQNEAEGAIAKPLGSNGLWGQYFLCLSWTLKERKTEWGGGSLVVGVMLAGGRRQQAWVTCNGRVLHCGHSTLITPFTITATYCPPTPHKLPKRPVSTISTMTQMKWIIVSLCGISWDKSQTREEEGEERGTKWERGGERNVETKS